MRHAHGSRGLVQQSIQIGAISLLAAGAEADGVGAAPAKLASAASNSNRLIRDLNAGISRITFF